MAQSLSFIICTECGKLEQLSILLARSIRRFGGALRDAPIISYQPRPGPAIARATARQFDRLQVVHRAEPLNLDYPDYAVANKPLANARAERDVDSDCLAFLDSDQVMLGEPSRLVLSADHDVGIRPVAMKGVGSGGPDDPNDAYWTRLYDLVGATQRTYLTSVVDKQRIVSYFNSGLVTVRREAGIFTAWAENFRTVMRAGLTPPPGVFYVEQSSLAATVAAVGARVLILPESYNYPQNLRERIAPEDGITDARRLVTAHYHGRRSLVDLIDANRQINPEVSRWLSAQMDELGIRPRTVRGRLTHLRYKLRQHAGRRRRRRAGAA